MFIDIHRHSDDNGEADLILRNVFHNESLSELSGNYFSVGLHPWHVKQESLDDDLVKVAEILKSETVIAVGEAGFDRSISTDFSLQLSAFENQLELASKFNLPMVIHCVRAYNELVSIRKNSKHKLPWIIHWFNASPEMAFDLIKKDCYLSFGTILFKEKTKGFKAFREIPLNRIFLETDDVDIPLTDIYKKASELRGVTIESLQEQIKENFENCFGISL